MKPGEMLAAASVAFLCAVVAVMGLSKLAKPERLDARLQAVANDAATIQRLTRSGAAPRTYPANAICSAAGADQVGRVKADLAGLAAALRLEHANIDVSPGDATSDGLSPLSVRLQAGGEYGAVVAALERLADLRPTLFIDTVDLSSKTSFVTLSLSGRVFCSART